MGTPAVVWMTLTTFGSRLSFATADINAMVAEKVVATRYMILIARIVADRELPLETLVGGGVSLCGHFARAQSSLDTQETAAALVSKLSTDQLCELDELLRRQTAILDGPSKLLQRFSPEA